MSSLSEGNETRPTYRPARTQVKIQPSTQPSHGLEEAHLVTYPGPELLVLELDQKGVYLVNFKISISLI